MEKSPPFNSAKKESVFICPYLLEDSARAFLRSAKKKTTNPVSLVYITNIKKNSVLPDTQWKRLNIITRLFYIFIYAETQKYYAINLRFSHKLLHKLETNNKKADFIRRRIDSNFKFYLGYKPEYAFILEEDKKHNMHLHGIMEIKEPDKTKHILKTTCFGSDYKESSFNKYIYQCSPLYNAGKWCAYCLKDKFAQNKTILAYRSRLLSQLTKFEYDKMKGFNTDGK